MSALGGDLSGMNDQNADPEFEETNRDGDLISPRVVIDKSHVAKRDLEEEKEAQAFKAAF